MPGGLMQTDPLLVRQAGWESNARSYPRRLPVALARAEGMVVTATDGRRFLDCLAGAGALTLGHGHPVVLAAVRAALDSGLPWQTLDLTTPAKDRFVAELLGHLPAELASGRIQFCGPSGADAVEAALKLTKAATGRRAILAFRGGYHGMTHGALAVTGNVAVKAPFAGLAGEAHFLPYPYPYRCPFGVGEGGHRIGSRYLRRMLDDPLGGPAAPAAVLVECVQGEGGVLPAPDEWLRELRRITAERGIPLILDEVQTGGGRTGTLFAFERAGVVPDVLVLSKAIGGGLPLAVVVYREELDRWAPGAHAGTFRGNQLAMVAGHAALRHTVEQRLPERAAVLGERLRSRLLELQASARCVGDVRGRGLMVGVELVDPDAAPDELGARPTAPVLAGRVQAGCLDRGLIVELGGRDGAVVRFLPPLVITPEQVDAVADRFADAVAAAELDGPR
ncbi:MAG TPA: diaminobutyrate--2-oxoglutarate transaminase [Mycobacteriales bacterium]|nr:diaminobutyrate--2-oxoglutarate transaminase [Mycobacteriales bacterium]